MATFLSKWESKCQRCENKILVGQPISWNRKGTVRSIWHVDCSNNGWGNGSIPEASTIPTIPVNVPVTAPQTAPQIKYNQMPDDLAGMIANAIAPLLKTPAIDADTVNQLIDSKLKDTTDTMLQLIADNSKPREITVTVVRDNESITRNVGKVHKQFDMLLKLVAAHSNSSVPINVWITGPAGSGKTKASEQVANALGLSFYFCGAIAEPYGLLGYMDAHGKVVRTPFREAYEHGGLFLLDEVDGSSANALLSFNAALANGHCAFPDAVVRRHKDCIILAAANTFGLGATNDYVGRAKLDAASLSRFVFLDWPYDEEMERALVSNQKWANRVIELRHKVKSLGLKILITPRATYTGDVLLSSGIPQAQVEAMVIKQGMTDDQWSQISGSY